MNNLGSKSRSLNVPRKSTARRLSPRASFWGVPPLLLLILAVGNTVAADTPNSLRASALGQSIAIADFDGDHLPDIAKVQAGPSSRENSSYWIELHLSASGSEFVRIIAPDGGLRIEARDVNGDRAVDLVLSTNRLRKPVAILLNDGHGRFSRVEPALFPDAFVGSNARWTLPCPQWSETACVPRQPRSSISSEAANAPKVRGPTGSLVSPGVECFLDPFLIWQPERAPPEVF